MHEDGSNFHKLWMTTGRNLNVEIRCKKLKVNFSYGFSIAFSRIKFTFFLSCLLGRFVLQLNRKICLFFFQYFLPFECLWKIRILLYMILEEHVFAWFTLHKSRQTVSYLRKFTWEKGLGERNVHNPVKQCIFYQYHQRFTVYTSSQNTHEMLSSYEYGLEEK